MRTSLATVSAILISFLMLSSVLVLEHPNHISMELEDEGREPVQFTSARGTSNSYLVSGGSSIQDIVTDHIAPAPNGGWVIGSVYNNSLTFGTKTLATTSPYPNGEFFLAQVDSTGTWQSLFGADHSFGVGGLSILTDISTGMGGEIIVTGQFFGEISFPSGSGNPTVIISNLNPNNHLEGFIAKADPMGNWLWANSFTTVVNGSGEFSSALVAQLDNAGDVIITGTFNGETEFGGSVLNVSSTQIFVAKYDGRNGVLNWAINSAGIGRNMVLDMAVTPSGGVKISTLTDGFVQWSSSNYMPVGTYDAVIVELDSNGGVLSLQGIGASNQQTVVTSITVDSSGDTYLAGSFGGTISSGGWTATAIYGANDVFVARNAVSTSNSWVFVSGSSDYDQPQALVVTSSGLVIFSGLFASAYTAGSTFLNPVNLDGYVIGISSSGALEWSEQIGSPQNDYIFSMGVDMNDVVGVGGAYAGTITHDGTSLTSTGGFDLFVWVFEPAALKDSDNDSIVDVDDNCPTTYNPTQVDTDGDSAGDECDSDDDNDGVSDNYPDSCPRNSETNWTSMQDSATPSSSTDWDNDGCKDDTDEDQDDDNDLILDVNDDCPYTSYSPPRPSWVSNATNDIDNDGCRDLDEDTNDDGDAFTDNNDDCSTLAGNSTKGTTGCLDRDGDGWSDTYDDCPLRAGNSTLGGENACPDRDGDGWSDDSDAFPDEATQWSDLDGDGYGDWPEGVTPDACPDLFGTSTLDRLGCFDSDKDGYSDLDEGWNTGNGADTFPDDPTQWSDYDEDGFGDNWGNSSWVGRDSFGLGEMVMNAKTQDACPTRSGTSWRADTLGCPDSDGDGWYDLMDAFSNDATQWEDSDMDGFGDNESGNQPDACPSIPGNSTADRFGCMDSDGDGYSNADLLWNYEEGADALPEDLTQWLDGDNDGFGENQNGLNPDNCPIVRAYSNIDRYGCPDTDGDGISDPDDVWTLADGADACISGVGNSSEDRVGCFDGDGDGYSNPTEDWSVSNGADAYPDDPLRWLEEKTANDGASSSAAVFIGIGGIISLAVIAGVAFIFLRKPDEKGIEKSWDNGLSTSMGGAMPAMPNMGAQPAAIPAVAMPNMFAQPTTQPVAQPVAQPDPAREYYNGLIAQGYPQANAIQYTQQYYPTFQG